MKGLNWFERFLFLLNSLFAVALLFSYLLPYIPPSSFALLSVFSLAVPLFIIINIIFFLYWAFRLKKQLLLSLVVLLAGFNHLSSIYEISSSGEAPENGDSFTILSYNVKQFNQFGWADEEDMPGKIAGFVRRKDPDIIGIQEYFREELNVSRSYPHRYVKLKTPGAEFGLSIFSKYPIINTGSLDFPTHSNNNGIYADVVIDQDTLRIINVHLQSYSVKPSLNKIEKEESKRVFLGMGQTFVRQEEQVEIVLDLVENTPHKSIVLGDFNNTAYSYIYRKMRSAGFNDAYKEAGNGFGRTYDFEFFPLRIDFIMPEEGIEVLSFETFDEVPYSDHFPIQARLKL